MMQSAHRSPVLCEGEFIRVCADYLLARAAHSRLSPVVMVATVACEASMLRGETIALLERWLISMADLEAMSEANPDRLETSIDEEGDLTLDQSEVELRAQEAMRSRSVWWVLGTSLIFECLVLGGAVFVFARRDN